MAREQIFWENKKFTFLDFGFLFQRTQSEVVGTSLVVQWVKNLPANAGNMGWIPGPGRFHMLRSN